MTNSGKFAQYGPGLVRRRIHFVTLGDCVESAVAGTLRSIPPGLGGELIEWGGPMIGRSPSACSFPRSTDLIVPNSLLWES